jgi:hypothetical protein
MTSPDTIDYSGKEDNTNSMKAFDVINITPWNDVYNTTSTHLVAFAPEVVTNFENGDYIGAFTSAGLCAGMTMVTDRGVGLVLNVDDVYTGISDGFISGETIAYKLYRPATEQQFDLEVTYDPSLDNSGTFAINSLSAVTGVTLTGIDAMSGLEGSGIRIFPNPSTGIFNIEVPDSYQGNADVELSIFNAFGEKVLNKEMTLPDKVDLTGQPKGVYFIRISFDRGSYFNKLVID